MEKQCTEESGMAKKAINRITQFLFAQQCTLRDLYVPSGKEVIQSVAFTRSASKVEIKLRLEGSVLHWSLANGRSGQAKATNFFRLNPFGDVAQVYSAPMVPRSLIEKIKTASKRLYLQVACIVRHLRLGGWDRQTRGLVRDLKGAVLNPERSGEGGFVCKWYPKREGGAVIEVIDHGGILDDNPNVEGEAYAPRVMANYYADGYAAYCFLREFQVSGDEAYFEAGKAAIDFLIRSYEDYPRGITWQHHEFKNPAFLECLNLLESMGRLPPAYRKFVGQLRLDRYEPTNVFALRYYWMTLQSLIQGKRDEVRIRECRERLIRDMTQDGLILDNNPPLYTEARDLTYHQYSLACLAGALAVEPGDKAVRDLFLEGCEFSAANLLRNGELSFNGRGAHNIYHIASAIYTFAFARKRYGFPAHGGDSMLDLIERHFQPDGSLPTALNHYPEERMGWNHCRTPYNALTAFLLIKASDEGLGGWGGRPLESRFMEDSGYATHRGANYDAAFFCGLGESYVYSGAHRTGVSGLAALVPLGGEPINLILDRSLRDNGLLTTDLPTFQVGQTFIEPIGGQIRKDEDGWSWVLENDQFLYERSYSFGKKCISVSNSLRKKTSDTIKVKNWWAFAVNESAYSSHVEGGVLKINSLAGPVKWSLQGKAVSGLSGWTRRSVISNPRGRGSLYQRSVVFSGRAPEVLFKDVLTLKLKIEHVG